MKVLDPGHRYTQHSLDGDHCQLLQFVKRAGDRYPGNVGTYPGTTLQEIFRAAVDRLRYVNRQRWALETWLTIQLCRLTIWLLEFRAARLHKRWPPGPSQAEHGQTCRRCGHVGCAARNHCRGVKIEPWGKS